MSYRLRGKRVLAGVLGSLLALAGTAPLLALEQPTAGIERAVFSASTTRAANLNALTGKRVTLCLTRGACRCGIVKATGDRLLHQEEPDGGDFCDALVSLQGIAALDTRVRAPGG